MVRSDSVFGTPARSRGEIGCRAMWQWTHSRGSAPENGSAPVSILYSVTPNEYRSLRVSIDRFIRPVFSGAMRARGPTMISGGVGDCDSRGRRDAIPNPVSQTLLASSTSTLVGL